MGVIFKVIFVKINDFVGENKIEYGERCFIEWDFGMYIEGEVDVCNLECVFGIVFFGGCWYFGYYVESELVWYYYIKKLYSYLIFFSICVVRLVVNIVVLNLEGVWVIDLCCGIGIVVVEVFFMGINIVGRDINLFVVFGIRKNIVYFGFEGIVIKGLIEEIIENYDVVIIDMLYDLFMYVILED